MLGSAKPLPNLREIAIALADYLGPTSAIDIRIANISKNFPIGHDGIAPEGRAGATLQDSILKISFIQQDIFQNSVSKVSSFQVSAVQPGAVQNSSLQISVSEIDPAQIALREIGITKVSSFQVGTAHQNTSQTGISENGLTQIYPFQARTTQIDTIQINPSKISFPSSITLQQLLSSYPHLYTSASTSTFKDNLLNLFDPTSPFNINLQRTDLPTGQLAEAQITNYDSFVRPNGGTILIDDDANGIGWFIIKDTHTITWDFRDRSSPLTHNRHLMSTLKVGTSATR